MFHSHPKTWERYERRLLSFQFKARNSKEGWHWLFFYGEGIFKLFPLEKISLE